MQHQGRRRAAAAAEAQSLRPRNSTHAGANADRAIRTDTGTRRVLPAIRAVRRAQRGRAAGSRAAEKRVWACSRRRRGHWPHLRRRSAQLLSSARCRCARISADPDSQCCRVLRGPAGRKAVRRAQEPEPHSRRARRVAQRSGNVRRSPLRRHRVHAPRDRGPLSGGLRGLEARSALARHSGRHTHLDPTE